MYTHTQKKKHAQTHTHTHSAHTHTHTHTHHHKVIRHPHVSLENPQPVQVWRYTEHLVSTLNRQRWHIPVQQQCRISATNQSRHRTHVELKVSSETVA